MRNGLDKLSRTRRVRKPSSCFPRPSLQDAEYLHSASRSDQETCTHAPHRSHSARQSSMLAECQLPCRPSPLWNLPGSPAVHAGGGVGGSGGSLHQLALEQPGSCMTAALHTPALHSGTPEKQVRAAASRRHLGCRALIFTAPAVPALRPDFTFDLSHPNVLLRACKINW